MVLLTSICVIIVMLVCSFCFTSTYADSNPCLSTANGNNDYLQKASIPSIIQDVEISKRVVEDTKYAFWNVHSPSHQLGWPNNCPSYLNTIDVYNSKRISRSAGFSKSSQPLVDKTRMNIFIHFSDVKQGYQAKSNITVNGEVPSSDIPKTKSIVILVINSEISSSKIKHPFSIPINHTGSLMASFSGNETTNISLLGNPSLFPFESYYVNLIFVIPFNTIFPNVNFISNSSERVDAAWKGMDMIKRVSPLSSAEHDLYAIKQKNAAYDVLIHFQRTAANTTIASIAIPLLAIFYLLGSIFILENFKKIDQLAIKVTMTLAIFAFLFTFIPILKDVKPSVLSSNNIPSAADLLITILLMATIAFTISSVASYAIAVRKEEEEENTLRKKQEPSPRLLSWIDAFAFFFIVCIVIYFTLLYMPIYGLRPGDITIFWLVPVILLGLGYGLLLRFVKWLRKGPNIFSFFTTRGQRQ